jgi:hypothetical protein
MPSDMTTFAFALKQRYTSRKVEDLTVKECPLMAMLNGDTDLQGEATPVPLVYGNPQGISNTVANSQTAATNLKGKKFVLTPGDLSGSVSITDKVIKASKSNKGAWLRARAAEIDGLYTQHGQVLNAAFWGNGGGSIGQIATGGIAGNVITLADPAQVINFEVGMYVQFSANDGSDVSHALRAGSTYVTVVNREAGTITVNDFGAITGETALDYIFRMGVFYGNSGTFVTHGVQSFVYSSSTPPDCYSMVRTDDPTRLAGVRVPSTDIAGRSIEDRIQILGTRIKTRGGGPGPSAGFLNPEDWQELSLELQSRGQRPLTDDSTRFGFQKLEVVTGGSKVNLYADPFAPKGHAFLLRMENWVKHSMGEMIQAVEEDGLTLLRSSTANTYEYRTVTYPAMSCNAPGWSGRVAVV